MEGTRVERTYSLTRPELLGVIDGDKTWQGGDQEWFAEEWQRKAGCGPTTGAHLISYLAQTRHELQALYPSCSWEKADFVTLMEQVWGHITPGRHGVNTLHLFTKGMASFAGERGLDLPIRDLDIPRFKIARPTVDQCAAFLRSGLEQDCPVAWLNLHNGGVPGLDSWHWVTVVGLEEHSSGPILCTFLDGGKTVTADFRLWFQGTKAGGGLVYVPRA